MTVARIEDVSALARAFGADMGEVKPNVRKNAFDMSRAPLPSDDETQGYEVGSRWQHEGQEWLRTEAGWVAVPRADATPAAFDSRDDLVAADDVAANSAIADGVLYRRAEGLSLPGLNNWRPLNDTLDIRHTGSTSELTSDFAGRFQQAVDDASAQGWGLHVSQKADRTPYEYEGIDHALTGGDLTLSFEKGAVLYPTTNFQAWPTNGGVGPFAITDFLYSVASHGALSAMLVTAAGVESKLSPGTHFTVSGNRVTLTTAPPAGSHLVVSTNRYAIQLRSTRDNGRRVDITGDLNIDLSRSGYVISSAAGSGLSLHSVDHWSVERMRVWSSAGYGSAPLDKRSDTALVPMTYKSGYVGRLHVSGMNDLALYATGNSSAGPEDDAVALQVGTIYASRCAGGAKLVRQAGHSHIGSIIARECGTLFLLGKTDDNVPLSNSIHVGSINGVRIGRRALDAREVPPGGLHVGAISVRDIGFMPDGVTPEESPAGVFLQAAAGVQIDYLDVRQKDWPTPAGVPALQVSGEGNYGNRILGGWVEGLSHGIRETGSTTNDVGNSYSLTLKDVATPVDTSGAMQTHYDLIVLSEAAGTVTQKRLNSLFSERETGTPTFLLAGASASPSYSYVHQKLTYRRMLDYVEFALQIQATITHSEPSPRSFRIILPSAITNSHTAPVPVTVGRISGLTLPSNDGVWGEVPPGSAYVRFYYRPSSGAEPVEITSAHVTSGSGVRIELAGTVPV